MRESENTYLTRTFKPIIRTILFQSEYDAAPHFVRISVPAHTFVFQSEKYYDHARPFNKYFLYFHHEGQKNYSFPYLPNINSGGKICLSSDCVKWTRAHPTEEIFASAIDRFWNSTFNTEWSGSLRCYAGILFEDDEFLPTPIMMRILQEESKLNPDFWMTKLRPIGRCFLPEPL